MFFGVCFLSCRDDKKDYLVHIHTPYGDMVALLYEETPLHKQNFLKLAKEGAYDSTGFHRVIKGFMVQGGDVNRKEGNQKKINHTIPAEIIDGFYHQKGALAAARMGDQQNPKKASSGSQFYIVHGKQMNEADINGMEEGINYQKKQKLVRDFLSMDKYQDLRQRVIAMQKAQDIEGLQVFMQEADAIISVEYPDNKWFEFTDEQKNIYTSIGGSPHLDGEYTVFGKVVEGLHVIDAIANQPTKANDVPVEDIRMSITLEKLSKKEISKRYGYIYKGKAE